VKKGHEHVKLKNKLVEAVAREQLVKAHQARKCLTESVVICGY
jgi:hypothetical protein